MGDVVFKIIYDYSDDSGASFSYPHKGKGAFIKFGMKVHKDNPLQFLHFVIHELKEIIQIEQSTRLYNQGKDGYEFHYTHAEHSDLCCRLAGLLSYFLK